VGDPQRDREGTGLERALASLGVSAADLPGFTITLVLALVVVDTVVLESSDLRSIREAWIPDLRVIAEVAIAYLIALIFYVLGEFWNEAWDYLYSVRYTHDNAGGWTEHKGKLADVDGRPRGFLWLIPGGRDLQENRVAAQELLVAAKAATVGDGIDDRPKLEWKKRSYAEVLATLQGEGAVSAAITASLTRARVCRTLILPVLALGILGLVVPGHWPLGVASILASVGLLVGFANQRVSHADAVYRSYVALMRRDKRRNPQ
jgi:hypothetical protein